MSTSRSCPSLRILLVDDEPAFRISLANSLRDDGHGVLEFAAPGEVPTLETLDGIALLMADYDLPGQDGFALADAFHAVHPAAPVIVITACRNQVLDRASATRAFVRLVEKPVAYEELHRLAYELVD
jgi:DNA-binding NtrC family response regulator